MEESLGAKLSSLWVVLVWGAFRSQTSGMEKEVQERHLPLNDKPGKASWKRR